MSALLLPVLFVTVGGSTFTGNEACHFVGSRFGRTPSTCEMGVCTNLHRLESGAYVRRFANVSLVACTDAQADAGVFWREHGASEGRSKRRKKNRVDSDAVIEALSRDIVPILEQLGFGISLSPEIVDPAFSSFDALVVGLFAENPHSWREDAVKAILESSVLSRMTRIYRHIIRGGIQRSLTYLGLRRSLTAAIHFYFDFAAMVGTHFLSPGLMGATAFAIGRTEPGYRPSTQWELSVNPSDEGVPESPEAVLNVSAALDLLAESPGEIPRPDLLTVYTFMAGWTRSQESASKSLFQDQMLSTICPRLSEIVRQLALTIQRTEPVVRLTVAFLEECRPVLPAPVLKNVRSLLAQWGQKSVNSVSLPAQASVGMLMEDNSRMAWDVGLTGPNPHTRALRLLRLFMTGRVRLFDISPLQATFTFANGSPALPRGFGRAVGLAILHGVDLSFLRLAPVIAKLLHPRFRQTVRNLPSVVKAISPSTPAALVNVMSGIEEVLGRGGFEIYSGAEWLAIFGIVQ